MRKEILGFSLFEILITLTIITILTLLVWPSLQETLHRKKSLLLRTQLLSTLRVAQQTARTLQLPVAVCHSEDQKHCSGSWVDGQLIFVNPKQDGIVHDQKEIVMRQHSKGISSDHLFLRLFPHHREYLLFSSTSLLSATNGTFWYCLAGSKEPTWAIFFNQSGRPRVVDADKGGHIKTASGTLKCVS